VSIKLNSICFNLAVAQDKQLSANSSGSGIGSEEYRAKLIHSLKGKRVLLTEDTRVNQIVATKMLGKLGMVVDIANNGEEALQCLEKSTYDIVLMDVQMPVMNGLEATRLIRLNPQFATLPILAMSAGVTLDEQEACDAAGMTGFVSKPISSAELADKLVDVCFPYLSDGI
jgi:CheY-like chemotaxis protein